MAIVGEKTFGEERGGLSEAGRIRATKFYVASMGVAALVLAGAWLYSSGISYSPGVLSAVLALGLLSALCRVATVRFSRASVDVADAANLLALAIFGPVWAFVVELPASVYRDPLRTGFALSVAAIKLFAAALAFSVFSPPLLFGGTFGPAFVEALLFGSTVFYALDALTNALLVFVKYGTPVEKVLRESFVPLLPADGWVVATVMVGSYAVFALGWLAAPIVLAGAGGALALLAAVRGRLKELAELRAENARLREDLRGGNLALAARLVENLADRDGLTPRLTAATAVYAADVGAEMGLDPERICELKVAALLMDAGLAGLPDEVLLTPPDKLNSVGRKLLEEHPERSERLLAHAHAEAASWVRWHHERPDGTGYPDRLKGKWTPLEAKILSAARSWAALVLDLPHRAAHPTPEARRRLVAELGSGVDAEVGRVLLRLLDSKDEPYRRASDGRFTFRAEAADLTREGVAKDAEGSGRNLRAV